jgi:hypothetical protein
MPQTLRTQSSPSGTRRRVFSVATSIRGAVKSLLLVLFAGLALALGSATPASAGIPCWQAVINDWYDNGKVDQTYPRSCYSAAISHLPTDVDTYSSAKDDIKRAELAALRGGGNGPGESPPATDPNAEPTSPRTPAASKPESSGKGPLIRTIEWLGPSDAASVPVPLLILAGVAFLLLAAAGGSFISRRLQARRLPPPQQP